MGEQRSLFGESPQTARSADCVRFGTSSFASPDWLGTFYPRGLPAARFLQHYATQFDTVEIDATYYATPTPETVAGWLHRTPEHFTIAAKFPRQIVHAGAGVEPDAQKVLQPDATYAERDGFLEVMSRLGSRLGPLVLQFPYFAPAEFETAAPFLARLDRFLADLPKQFSYAVELRNASWLTPAFAVVCRAHDAALVLVDRVHMPHGDEVLRALGSLPGRFAYIRMLGDRHRIEQITTTWDREVIDHGARLQRWAEVLVWLRERNIPTFVYANNHYGGHAPTTARRLQQLYAARAGIAS